MLPCCIDNLSTRVLLLNVQPVKAQTSSLWFDKTKALMLDKHPYATDLHLRLPLFLCCYFQSRSNFKLDQIDTGPQTFLFRDVIAPQYWLSRQVPVHDVVVCK